MRNAVNHAGWNVEWLTPEEGWKPLLEPFVERSDAEATLKAMKVMLPSYELRVYEALK